MNKDNSRIRDVLSRAFSSHEIVWRATAISSDQSACEFSPLVRISAYHRRLNSVLRQWSYSPRFLPETSEGQRFVAECVLELPGVGSYRGLGVMPAEAKAAPERAQAKAFQNACAKAGVGTQLRSTWVAINMNGEPQCLPSVPHHHSSGNVPGGNDAPAGRSGPTAVHIPAISHLDAIRALQKEIGENLYRAVLRRVKLTADSPEALQRENLRLLQALRAVARTCREARALASSIPEHIFYELIEENGVESLFEISSIEALDELVRDLRARDEVARAATPA